MPAILGQFESSLRGRCSNSGTDLGEKKILHKGCSGASHGHGVRKERTSVIHPRDRRNCSLPPESSSDECATPPPPLGVPDLLLHGETNRRASCGTLPARRSSSEVIKRMLYGSATKADLKNRCNDVIDGVEEVDSGLASSDSENKEGRKPYNRSLSAEECQNIRARQRQERREYLQRHRDSDSPHKYTNGNGQSPKFIHSIRKQSPSPMSRRNSAGGTDRESSLSPPLTPSSPKVSKSSIYGTLPRRTKSTSSNNISPRKASAGYAFGSSVERFSPGSPGHKQSLDSSLTNGGGSHTNLTRTCSDSKVTVQKQKAPHKSSVTKAWLQFQADVEIAMKRKPGSAGLYKNLTDMMQDRMLQLDQAKSQDQISCEKAWLEAERVWLVHTEGFTGARQVKESDSGEPLCVGKVRVKLDCNDDVIEVDEDDVEKANPPSFDRVEDLAQLRYLNESSVLQTLSQRYGNNVIHTYAGPSIITINPCLPLDIYSEKVIHMFKGCRLEDMPPHIFSVGQTAYRTLMSTRKDQSIVMIGRSGSGKTSNFKHVLNYLSVAAGSTGNILSPSKVASINKILESFGNSRTVMNTNATRFSQIFSVDFDHSGVIASASMQIMMLEKSRVVRRPEGEPNFNIFYQFLAGLEPKLKKELHLENLSESNLFMTPLQGNQEKASAAKAFAEVGAAAGILDIQECELKAIWSVLGAIYHLGVAGVGRTNGGKAGFARPPAAQKAATCLGTTVEDLSRLMFQGTLTAAALNRKHRNDATAVYDGLEALEGFVVGLYQESFNLLMSLINRSITSSATTAGSVLVVDTPGFQNPATCGRQAGATLEELCHNYGQERLQLMFHDKTITALKERYISEQIIVPDLEDLTELSTPAPLVALIDKQSMLRSSQSDLSQAERRGLLWLLDEEALFPGASDQSFVERLLQQYSDRDSQDLLKKGSTDNNFILQHFQGTNPVLYDATGWLKSSRENPVSKSAVKILHESTHKSISDLFLKYRSTVNTTSGSIVGVEGSQSLRRASSIRRALTSGTAGIKRHSVALQTKFQIDALLEQLRRTRVKFVHCFLPQHKAGLAQIKNKASETVPINVPLVRSQLRGAQILDAVRLYKVGFPESLGYGEFWRRFSLLGSGGASPSIGEEKAAVEKLLVILDLDHTSYRLGNTQIFLRGGVLSRLEEERDEALSEKVVRLQALARGHLARRKLQKLRTQDIAIRCIQKNVRKFMAVREWPWWRLLIKVTPMLNVHRTEEQLRSRTDELENLRARLEKVEKERTEYKELSEKLEARLSEMTADLAEEHSTAVLATERLETEQSDRMKLEKERSELQAKNKHLVSNSEQMQMELLYSRGGEINGVHDSDDEEGAGIYRAKYERSMKELEYTKKRLQQQHEDDMDQLMCLKKQLEKKLNDAYEEVDEQRQVVGQWKRKAQKIQGEMNDTRLLLEEQTSRNALLEKKQRKFDSELGLANDDKRQEILTKEKLQKELDSLKQVKHSLEDQIHAMKLDAEFKEDKLSALQRELSEMQDTGVSDDEVRQLKKSNHDLEMRLKDQEEELDDLAGQVQLLESSKTKLEMQMAQIKKEQRREMQSKEDELEDARAAANKKVKVLEQQLEQEHEERIGFLRERHELEGKIMTLQDMLERAGDEEQLAKLRKDLKRTKALLRDAQLMIEKSHNEGSNKVMIRQLKNQLEDAEFTRTAAMKSKQNAELELADVQQQLDDMIRAKNDLEDRHLKLSREKAEYAGQLQENEEDLQEVMKKYKASVNAVTTDQITIQDQAASIAELEAERNKLRETVAELSIKVESMEGENVTTTQHKRLELKIRELESKLELEQTTRGRLETQISRLKEGIEKLNSESDQLRVKEQTSQEGTKKVSRQLRDLKEDYTNLQTKETEMTQKKSDLEKQLEISEGETVTAKNELKLAMKRIEDLQIAIAGEIDTDETNSEDNSESSDEEMHSFLEHHRRAMSVQRERESMARESVLRDSVAREIRASMAREVSVGRDSSVGRDFSVGRDSSVARDFAVGRSLPSTTIREEPDFTSSPNNSITEGDESQA